MDLLRALLAAALLVAVPVTSTAEVIPISEVNEDNEYGQPVLWQQTVTVRGVVTVGTGVLAPNTDIYIQDGTGGLNIVQPVMASPAVSAGDSVLVTGRVSMENGDRTSIRVNTSVTPGARIEILNSGNPVPEPVELTVREVALGEEWEGTYAVVRNVGLTSPPYWPPGGCSVDQATYVADGDTTCRFWFDKDTDLCGSPMPLDSFDVYGVVIPRPRIVSSWRGHGLLPPTRAHVSSHGSGAGFAGLEPERVHVDEAVRLEFDLRGEADVLTDVTIEIADGWWFSGSAADVGLDGPAFATASVDDVGTSPDVVVIEGCALADGSPGTVTIANVEAPSVAGDFEFVVSTAVAGEGPVAIGASPSVAVGDVADPGEVLINEIYSGTGGPPPLEFYNPDLVDMTGWVVAVVKGSGDCRVAELWEVTPTGRAPSEYVVTVPAVAGEDGDPGVATLRLLEGQDDREVRTAREDAYRAYLLYSDRTLAYLVDAVEYRDPVFFREDPCSGFSGLGGPDDAWAPSPIPAGYSIGRDAVSTDTHVSRDDFFLSSTPTHGSANIPYDELPPSIAYVRDAGSTFALVVFNEPVDRGDAENVDNYSATGGLGLHRAWLSRSERTVLIRTDPRAAGVTYSITVSPADGAGIHDPAGNRAAEDTRPMSILFELTTPIEDIQAYDENGYSLLVAESAAIVGFATVPPGVFQADRTNMYVQDLEGWGVNVYRNEIMADPPLEGDLVGAVGTVVDYVSSTSGGGATTEVDAERVEVLARGFDLVGPTVLATGDVGREENEGALIRSTGVVVSVEGFAFYIDDGSGAIQAYQNFSDLDFSVFAVGDRVEVTGVVLQYDLTAPYFSGYELAPRYPSDMVVLETHYTGSARLSAAAKVLDIGGGEAIEITYNAPEASRVTVRVFDLKGREVATLYDGICLGPQTTVWDGRYDRGSKVPAGVYICHVQSRERASGDGSDAAVPIVVGRKLD